MYDAVDDPYTYENSTVLVNKLELREQAELDAFEAEISSARADEPLPEGNLDFTHDGSAFADKAAHFLAELNAIHAFAKATAVRSSRSLPCWLTMQATRLISTSSTRLKCWMP